MDKTFRNVALVALSTVGSRVLGLARDVFFFSLFGAGAVSSAFLFAFTLPNLFRRLLGEGALSSALIPVMAQEQNERGEAGSFALLSRVFTRLFLVLLGIILLGLLVLWSLQYIPGLPERWYLGSELGLVLFPYVLFVCLAAVLAAALNVFGRFTLAALSQVWLNLAMLGAMGLALFWSDEEMRAYVLSIGVLAGGILQLLIPAAGLRRQGYRGKFDLSPAPQLAEMRRLLIPGLAAAAVFQVNIVVGRVLAFWVEAEAVSLLYLASRLIELPLGVFGIAFATVLFPQLAHLAAREDWGGFGREYQRGGRVVLAIMVPAAVGLVMLDRSILNLLFAWGAFSAGDVSAAEGPLLAFALSMPFFALGTFATRGLHALKDMRTPYRASILNFALNLGFSLALLRYGATGLAAATGLSITIHAVVLEFCLRRKREAFGGFGWQPLLRIIGAAAGMAVCVWGLSRVGTLFVASGKAQGMWDVFLVIPVSAVVYLLLLWALRFEERHQVLALLKRSKKQAPPPVTDRGAL